MALTDELCRSFLDLWWHFDPAAATAAGIPGQDGRLGGYDSATVREHVAALRSIAAAAEDLEVEATADEIDRTALLDHLRVLLFRFEHEKPHRRDPVFWIEHACRAFSSLLHRSPEDVPAIAAALARLRELPRFLDAARETLREPPIILMDAGAAMLPALSALVDQTTARFEPAWAMAGAAERREIVAGARESVARMSAALRAGIVPSPDPGAEAIGEEEVDRRLHHEHASVHNGAEVWRGANRAVAEIEAEVIALAAAIDPGQAWQDVWGSLGKAGEDWGNLGKAGEDWRQALAEAWQFAELAGFGGMEPPLLEVREAPGYVSLLEPLASYRPGGGGVPAAILVGEAAGPWLPWLAARLGPPGLHLHRFRSDILPGLVRRHIATSSTVLGFAAYTVELVRDHGLQPDPALRLAERVMALYDAHLAVCDLGIHTRQFTAAEAIGYLAARVPIERSIAQADVRRIVCQPTSAAAEMLGRRELIKLQADARDARGSSFVLSELHEELFGYGGLPVPLIRWGMGLDE